MTKTLKDFHDALIAARMEHAGHGTISVSAESFEELEEYLEALCNEVGCEKEDSEAIDVSDGYVLDQAPE